MLHVSLLCQIMQGFSQDKALYFCLLAYSLLFYNMCPIQMYLSQYLFFLKLSIVWCVLKTINIFIQEPVRTKSIILFRL